MPNAPVPASGISLPFSSRPPRRRRNDLVADVSHWQPPAPATPRAALEGAIEAAIALLDASEPDPDLEDTNDREADTADEEPSLGASSAGGSGWGENASQERWAAGNRDGWSDEGEPDVDDEPWLGVPENHPSSYGVGGDQTAWARGSGQDLEDEHDGKEPDADGEPSHGSTSAINQEHAWAPTETFWGSGEGEPSLASTNIPAMLPRGYDSDREGGDDDREFDPAEDGIGDLDGLAEQTGLADGGGMLPCLDQRVENASSIMSDDGRSVQFQWKAVRREQRAMQRTAKRLRKIVKRLQESA